MPAFPGWVAFQWECLVRSVGRMGRSELKRVKDLVGTLAWSVPELNPRAGTLPANPDGLDACAEFDVLPGIRALVFPHGDEWRAVAIQFGADGQVAHTMEHGQRAANDDLAPRFSMQVFCDLLSSVVAGGTSATLPQERLDKIPGLIDRV